MKKQPATVQTHLEIARRIREARQLLDEAYDIAQNHYRKSSPQLSRLWALIGGGKRMDMLQGCFDDEWHRTITDKEFTRYGHIYFGAA